MRLACVLFLSVTLFGADLSGVCYLGKYVFTLKNTCNLY